MINAKITLMGIDKAQSQLANFSERIKNLSKPMQEAGEMLMEFFSKDVYESEGGAISESWAPLTEPYQSEKLKKWGPTPILIASGKMSRDYKLLVASDYLIISNEAKNQDGNYYAGYHQEGTSKMLARPIMKFQETQLRQVADILVKYINSLI